MQAISTRPFSHVLYWKRYTSRMRSILAVTYSIKRSPSGVVYEVKRCSKTTRDAFKLTRVYYHQRGTSEFRKTIFYVHGMHVSVVGACMLLRQIYIASFL